MSTLEKPYYDFISTPEGIIAMQEASNILENEGEQEAIDYIFGWLHHDIDDQEQTQALIECITAGLT